MGVDMIIYYDDPSLDSTGESNECFSRMESCLYRNNKIIDEMLRPYQSKQIYHYDIENMLQVLILMLKSEKEIKENERKKEIGEAIMLCGYLLKECPTPVWVIYSI